MTIKTEDAGEMEEQKYDITTSVPLDLKSEYSFKSEYAFKSEYHTKSEYA